MPTVLPSKAHLDHFKKQAKALLKAAGANDIAALDRFAKYHPNYAGNAKTASRVKLQEAQLVIAREYDFPSWAQLLNAISKEKATETTDAFGSLILTNGLAAIEALERSNILGRKEEWLEVLHEGPIPLTSSTEELNRIRAKHISSLGWSSEEAAFNRFQKRDRLLNHANDHPELFLFFEHDLYDQLQLIQILNTLADLPEWLDKTKLIQSNAFISTLNTTAVKTLFDSPVALTAAHINLGQQAWSAFRQNTPKALDELLNEDLSLLPYLKSSLLRIRQEFPDPTQGLGRTERQILEAVADNNNDTASLFRSNQAKEEAAFMGDASFFNIVERLSKGQKPLLKIESSDHLLNQTSTVKPKTLKGCCIYLTDTGKSALEKRFNRLTDLPAPYWIGGSKIENENSPKSRD